MKKLIALLLALMMALVCVTALAAGEDEPVGSDTPAQNDGGNQGEDQGADQGENLNGDSVKTELTDFIKDTKPSINTNDYDSAGATATTAIDVTIPKKIQVKALNGDKHPEVTLAFTVDSSTVELSTVETAPEVTIESVTLGEDDDTKDITIHLPSYKAVGIYTYEVIETPTNYAGMVEVTGFQLKVTVTQYIPQEGEEGVPSLMVAGIAIRQEGIKTDEIENLYKAGGLKVTKEVSGNMGDRTKAFPITVVLKAPAGKTVASTVTYTKGTSTTGTAVEFNDDGEATIKIDLKHGEYIEIHNLPEDVEYTVTEDDTIKRQAGTTPTTDEMKDPDTYQVSGEEKDKKIKAQEQASVTIKNIKNIDVDTGVALDSTVYMLIMALALVGFVALKVRRREEY